jgi:hypothetical protein
MKIKEITLESWKTGAAIGAGLGGLVGGVPGALLGAYGGGILQNIVTSIRQSKNYPLYQSALKKLMDIAQSKFGDIIQDPRAEKEVESYKNKIDQIAYSNMTEEEKISGIKSVLKEFQKNLNNVADPIRQDKKYSDDYNNFVEKYNKWTQHSGEFYNWYLRTANVVSDSPGPGLIPTKNENEYINQKKLNYLMDINTKFNELILDKVTWNKDSDFDTRLKVLKQLISNYKKTLLKIDWSSDKVDPQPLPPPD